MKKIFMAGLMALLQSPYVAQETGKTKTPPKKPQTAISVNHQDSTLFAALQKAVENLTGELGTLNAYLKEKTREPDAPRELCAKITLKTQPLAIVRADVSGKDVPVLSDRMKRYTHRRKRERKVRKHMDEVRYKMVFVEKVVMNVEQSKITRLWVKYRDNVNGNTAAKTCIAQNAASGQIPAMALGSLNQRNIKIMLNNGTGEFIYLNEFLEYQDYFGKCDDINGVIELNTETNEKAITQ